MPERSPGTASRPATIPLCWRPVCKLQRGIPLTIMTKRLYFVAHGGVVQGVGFRFFTRQKAQLLGVTGWCRNTADNKVEGEVQGEDSALDSMLQHLQQGPSHATVARLTQEAREIVPDEPAFVIRR